MLRRTEEGLEVEVKKKGEELAVAAEELSKRQREVADLRQVAQGLVYQRVYDCGWNRAGDLYVQYTA